MAKVNTLHMEMEEREFEEAYAKYLEESKGVAEPMSEGEFADYWYDKKQSLEDNSQFGVGA